jgi:hypothetical protein
MMKNYLFMKSFTVHKIIRFQKGFLKENVMLLKNIFNLFREKILL